MATYPALTPLATAQPGSLLGAASRELERQLQESIPAGKQGAVILVADKTGTTIGVATVIRPGADRSGSTAGVEIKVAASLKQKWEKAAPEASFTVQASW